MLIDPISHNEWGDAALHVVGERTAYRLSGAVPMAQLYLPAHKLACWRKDGHDATTDWYFQWFYQQRLDQLGVSRQFSNSVAAYLDYIDGVDGMRCLDKIEASIHALVRDGLMSVSGGAASLTLAGVVKAVGLRPRFSDKNVTSVWLASTVDANYIRRLTTSLTLKCPRSAQFGELEDLIQNYMADILRRDGFRTRILSGRPPAFSDVKQWVYNAALSMWRNEGRDAQTREFKGARTEKDLRQENDDDVASRSIAVDTQAIFLVTDGDGDVGAMSSSGGLPMPLVDVHGGNLEDEMLHRLSWLRGMERAAAVIRLAKQGAPERFARLLHEVVVEDATLNEIKESEGVSRNRAAMLVHNLSATLHQEGADARLVVKILTYLRENPFSTRADMEAPVNNAADAVDGGLGEPIKVSLLDSLVKAGRITCTGKGNTSYCITNAGEKILSHGDYFGMDLDIRYPLRGVDPTTPANG